MFKLVIIFAPKESSEDWNSWVCIRWIPWCYFHRKLYSSPPHTFSPAINSVIQILLNQSVIRIDNTPSLYFIVNSLNVTLNVCGTLNCLNHMIILNLHFLNFNLCFKNCTWGCDDMISQISDNIKSQSWIFLRTQDTIVTLLKRYS